MYAKNTCGDSLWSVTFLKLCHVLCNFSAIVIFEIAAWLQALLDGVYILRMASEKTTQQVCTFDESILLYQVKFIHLIFSNVWFYKCIFAM